jgi:hypothetical protein
MAWNTITSPNLGKNRRKRKLTLHSYGGDNSWSGTTDNFNMLQQVYRGRYDRMERYKLYDWMDQDSDVARALDITAEHCSPKNDKNHFWNFKWALDPTEEESGLIMENMTQWSRINEWDNRLWRHVRDVLKYGDWFYFRNPDTFELFSLHPRFVLGALVDQESVEVVAWIVRNFQFNVENIELAVDNRGLQDSIKSLSLSSGMRNTKVIPASHIMHLSMSEGKFSGATGDDDPSDRYNNRWPFGESMLEDASKTFKQRELLEDAALIHRVQRAPSRTVWYIDTGKMRPDRSSWVVNNFKNELNQKRVPQIIGQEQRGVDSVYNPISQLEDIYIPVSFDQRGSKVETLEGQPWNELPDLQYFTKKMMRALQVPHSWLLGPEEGGSVFNDGRVGVAYQEEINFSKRCSRIQKNLDDDFDFEFKMYCKMRDVNILGSDFDMMFNEPTNYDDFKNNARDQDNIAVWSSVKDEPYISRRFALIKYMNWTEDEVVENERMILEERFDPKEAEAFGELGGGAGAGLGSMPPPPGGDLGLGPGTGNFGDMGGGDMGDIGATGADMGGGGMAMTGAAGAGGFGEDVEAMKFLDLITEAPITGADLKAAPEASDELGRAETPDDKLHPVGANIEGHEDFINSGGQDITLGMLQKVRKSHMSRRVENSKRMKMIQKVYVTPAEDEFGGGGLGGGGLGGGGLGL